MCSIFSTYELHLLLVSGRGCLRSMMGHTHRRRGLSECFGDACAGAASGRSALDAPKDLLGGVGRP